jgi:ABC-type transporter Mla subunit MlaD
MTESAAWVLVALVALFVGTAVPALLQLRKTLRATEDALQSTRRHLNDALDRLTATLDRLNRAADGLEHGVSRFSNVFEAVGGIADALAGVKTAVETVAAFGSVVGGALAAALGSTSRRSDDRRERTEQVSEDDKAP